MPRGYKNTIEDCKKLAADNGGQLLTSEYKDVHTKCVWKCKNNHTFELEFHSVKRGDWCRECGPAPRVTVEKCRIMAQNRNGLFLSDVYQNAHVNYLWKCAKNHEWLATYANTSRGSWCDLCQRISLEDCIKLAEKKSGSFLSKECLGSSVKHSWRCSSDHQWQAPYAEINRGAWCPLCKDYTRGQNDLTEFCKLIDPKLTTNATPLLKPNHRLQLDVYWPELKKAIELDGDYWHSNEKAKQRDARKNKACEEIGIKLLRIDYTKQWHRHNRPIGEQMIRDFLK